MNEAKAIRFSEILGQDRAKAIVQCAISKGRIPHAYLFTGIAGVGKTSLGRAIAAYLNCKTAVDSEPCGECGSCKQIRSSGHPNLIVVRPDGESIKIEQIRDIQESMRFSPLSGKYRVVIMDQADTMTEEAANAFLKTLEEPPQGNLLILNAIEPDNLLPTIVSRCQRVSFVPLGVGVIADYLTTEMGVERDRAVVLARLAEGSLGRAVAMVEADFLERRDQWLKCAMEIPGLKPEELLDLALELSNEKAPTQGRVAKYQIGGLLDLLGVLAMWYRDLLVMKQKGAEGLILNVDFLDQLKNFSKKFKVLQLYESLLILDQAQTDIRMRRNKALVLERTMLRLRDLAGVHNQLTPKVG